MSLFGRRLPTASQIPVVPDDKAERAAAIEASRKALEDARGRIDSVTDLVKRNQQHVTTNHYQLRLDRAYGIIRP